MVYGGIPPRILVVSTLTLGVDNPFVPSQTYSVALITPTCNSNGSGEVIIVST